MRTNGLWFKSKLDIEEDAASMTRQAQLFSTDKVLVAVIAGESAGCLEYRATSPFASKQIIKDEKL